MNFKGALCSFFVFLMHLYQSAIILNHFAGLNVSLSALKHSHLEQLNSEFFAYLSTRFSTLKIDHLIKRIGIIIFFYPFMAISITRSKLLL